MRKLPLGNKFIPYCLMRFYSLNLRSNSRPEHNEKTTSDNRININKQRYYNDGTNSSTRRSCPDRRYMRHSLQSGSE